MDSDLFPGDYIQLKFAGNWTFFLQDSFFIEGIQSDSLNTAYFADVSQRPTYSIVNIQNFSSISRQSQISFYISMMTPLTSGTYLLSMIAYRSNGGIAEHYYQNLTINDTTGYIR